MSSSAHTILLVEDDADTAASIAELFRVMGWRTLIASNLEEFRERLRDGGYCLAIHDLETPASAEMLKPTVDVGILGIQEHREAYPRAGERGMHYMPLLCMSAFAKDHRNGRRARRAGVDDALVKPLDENDEPLADAVKRMLRESGREDHARCAHVSALGRAGASEPPQASPVVPALREEAEARLNHLSITGQMPPGVRNRTALTVNGAAMTMTHRPFTVLLHLIEGRMRGVGSVTDKELGAREGDNFRLPSVMQQQLEAYLVPGTKVYDTVKGGRYALSRSVVIDAIDTDALLAHDERAVVKLATSIASLLRTQR